MRLETFPLIAAIVVALVGLGLILDARLPDQAIAPNEGRRERRRAPRIDRHRGGETLVGIGILALAAALAGRDSWRYSIVAAIAGALFVLWGALLNRRYLATLLSNRGKLRRRDGPPAATRPAATRPSAVRPPATGPTAPPATTPPAPPPPTDGPGGDGDVTPSAPPRSPA